jgi:nitrate reductase gamma subunit
MNDIIMVIATVAIAIFSGISCLVAHRIHQSTQKRDKEINDILEKLIAATLASGQGAGYEKTMAGFFKDQLKALRELKYD